MCASTSTTIPSRTPRCSACSRCWPIRTRCASSMARRCSLVIAAATTRERRSRTPATSRPWSSTSTPHAATAVPTTSQRRHRRARPCSCVPPSAVPIWEPSPPPCCGCWSATAPPSLTPPSARRSSAACLIPMRCGSHSSTAASCATRRRPSPSFCPSMSRCAMSTCSRTGSNPMTNSRSKAMSNLEALHMRAKALNLHGLLAHWEEAAVAGWAGDPDRLGGAGAHAPKPGAPPARRSYRTLQAALRLRLDLAQTLRPLSLRSADGARLPQRRNQRHPGRPQRGRQINARAQHRPSGYHPRSHRAVHQRRSTAQRPRRARQRFRPAPALASLCRPPSSGDRRGRLSLLFQSPCRSAVRARQPPLRAQQHDRHHQPALRRMARGLSKRRLRRLPGRSPVPQRRDPRHRGRILSPQGGPGTSRAAGSPTPQSQVMTKTSNGLPLTIPLNIPAYWTPEQAFAVVELLDELRARICAHYGVQLLDQYREQYSPTDSDHTDDKTDNPSF